MAAYAKERLLALLERKRASELQLRDFNERAREAHSAMRNMQSIMERGAGSASGHLASLFALPAEEAAALTAAQVTEYQDGTGKWWVAHINYANFQAYVLARTRYERLSREQAALREAWETQFAIVPKLVDFVLAHGFANPELET